MVERFETEFENYKDSTHFMEIVDRDLWWLFYQARYINDTLDKINHGIPLHILRSKGIEVSPDFDLKVTDLNKGDYNHKAKMFHDTGDGGIDFKVDVIIGNNETWGISVNSPDASVNQWYYNYKGVKYPNKDYITSWLNWFYLNKRPVNIVTDAIDINNGTYIITSNTRKQTLDNYTVWSLEFTTYEEYTTYIWVNSPQSLVNTELSYCTMDNFRYRPTRTETTKCARWLQERLYQLGFLKTPLHITSGRSGWYDDDTLNAVKRFQEKFGRYYNLKATGMMDEATLKALSQV